MKYVIGCGILAYTIAMSFPLGATVYEIHINPQWVKLDTDSEKAERFGGSWILAGDIVFKNKSPNVIKLDAFDLQWQGAPLEHLSATLFKKDEHDQIMPIQEHVISDGYWSQKEQTLKFRFDQKYALSALNKFYLVFTVPKDIEDTLKTGTFSLNKRHLPYQYQRALRNKSLNLSYATISPNARLCTTA
ncbi:hypothetical protein JW872_03205 [Candidatus Babeliales bacterium]|nr:hypothetical protein [Candidatus Babeliales bacterium]